MRKFSEEEIAHMRNLRAQGLAYQQIADQMPIKFKRFGGKAPSKSAVRKHTKDVKVLAEGEELPEVEVDFPEEEEWGVPVVAAVSKEDKKEIVKRLNKGDTLKEVAEDFPLDEVLKVERLYEQLKDPELLRCKKLLLANGYLNSLDESLYDGIERLLDENIELEDKAEFNEHQTNEMFRGYREREEEDKLKIASLEKTLNEERRKHAEKEKQYNTHITRLQTENRKQRRLLEHKGIPQVFGEGYFVGVEQTINRLLEIPEMNLLLLLRIIKSRLHYQRGTKDWFTAMSEMAEILGIPNAQEFTRKLERAQKLVEQTQNAS